MLKALERIFHVKYNWKYTSRPTSSLLLPYYVAVFDDVIINYSGFILGLHILTAETRPAALVGWLLTIGTIHDFAVYRTDESKSLVPPVVRAVEARIVADRTLNHDYLPIAGLPEFRNICARLLLGENSRAITENRVSALALLRLLPCVVFVTVNVMSDIKYIKFFAVTSTRKFDSTGFFVTI